MTIPESLVRQVDRRGFKDDPCKDCGQQMIVRETTACLNCDPKAVHQALEEQR